MYLFSFQYGNGFWKYQRIFSISEQLGNAWDLYQNDQDIFLLLWEEIAFSEKYTTKYPLFYPQKQNKNQDLGFFWETIQEEINDKQTHSNHLIEEHFFDEKYLDLLHRMVKERFSDYKNVMKYFVPLDIVSLLKREPTTKDKKKKEQTLYVFPDNWTRFNFLGEKYKEDKENLHLFSMDTEKKKNEHRRKIKYGEAKNIYVTQSEIFQPYTNLKTIYFIDPYKRYYHNQQDPRYSIKTVIQKLQELYQAEIKEISFKKTL